MPIDVKQQIANAMFELSKTKDPGKITVKDLVSACGVSRQIFYYYYQDIYEVFAYILRQDVEIYTNESIGMDTPIESVTHFVGCLVDNIDMFKKGLESKLRPDIESLMLDTFKKYIRILIEQKVTDVALRSVDLNFLTNFIACGLVGTIIDNSTNKDFNVDEYCTQLLQLVRARLDQLNTR